MILRDTDLVKALIRAGQNPMILFSCTLILWLCTWAITLLPADAVLSGAMPGLAFFKLPLPTFYLTFLLLWVAFLRRIGILAFLFFILALGTLSLSTSFIISPKNPRKALCGAIVFGEILIYYRALPMASPMLSFTSIIATTLMMLLFFIIKVMQSKPMSSF